MKTEQRKWTPIGGWNTAAPTALSTAQLVFVFGATEVFELAQLHVSIRELYPTAKILGCTTAGEICDTEVLDGSAVVTAVLFEHTRIHSVRVKLDEAGSSLQAGESLGRMLPGAVMNPATGVEEKLAHVFVLSDGLKVNGSDLVTGITRHLPAGITVTGGLAGDGTRFGKTLTLCDGEALQNTIVALGFYGSRLRVGVGSLGGWDSFGPERLVTRSAGNILYELDGRSALDLYKKYLGEHAQGLPATGLLFPLSLRTKTNELPVVRTILNVDNAEHSMTFAGDVPEGSYVRLMKANFDRLIDGAAGAARTSYEAINTRSPELAILISCVGRKLVLKQRTEEEVEGVRDVLGSGPALTGFYSYGEISPFGAGGRCELHNQTMTITTFAEA